MKILRIYRTIRYLKLIQIYYRIKYMLLHRITTPPYWKGERLDLERIPSLGAAIKSPIKYRYPGRFVLLNIQRDYTPGAIDWNDTRQGKLWLYHLCSMEFLMQEEISREQGVELIRDIMNFKGLKDGMEPWPLSIRLMHVIRFLCRYEMNDPAMNAWIKMQADYLSNRLEWHLMANHLLENLFALVMSAIYLDNKKDVQRYGALLKRQLDEQILADGGHFERTPMYHSVMLQRVLDLYNIQKSNPELPKAIEDRRLTQIGGIMLGWLQQITLPDGRWAHFNDSTEGIAATTATLSAYAESLGVVKVPVTLSASGYRRYRRKAYEMVIDAGDIGPSYQPGHGHCDIGSFVLYTQGKPWIIDTGISTYERGERRLLERSTAAHNTVCVDGREQSEIWAAFRVGRRAKIADMEASSDSLKVSHDGYAHLGVIHTRNFRFDEHALFIEDQLAFRNQALPSTAYLHLHPDIALQWVSRDELGSEQVQLRFEGAERIELQTYKMAEAFNKTREGVCVAVQFKERLTTSLTFGEQCQ